MKGKSKVCKKNTKRKEMSRVFYDLCKDEVVREMIEKMKDLRKTIEQYPEFKEAYFGENYFVKERIRFGKDE